MTAKPRNKGRLFSERGLWDFKNARPEEGSLALTTWMLSVASVHKVTKELHVVRYKFLSPAKTVEEAFKDVYDSGFACVQKVNNKVMSTAQLSVRLSSGEL